MTFQLILPTFNANVDHEDQQPKAPTGCNRQGLSRTTDAMARNQSRQLSLWAIAEEKARLTMEAREIRGIEIAAATKLTDVKNRWIVPSQQNSSKTYTVDLNASPPRCTCPDYEANEQKCKHIYAVEYAIRREQGEDIPVAPRRARITYKQEWHEYNQAATREKAHFQHLLYELCRNIPEPEQPKGRGRPCLPLAAIIFGGALKVYTKFSGRRSMSDLKQAHARGYVSPLMHYNSISRYLEQASIAPYLHHLIERSALPLLELESVAAVDSTGFSTNRFVRWLDAKHKQSEEHREWLKLHALVGVRTNVIVCAEVTDAYQHDYHHFKPLVDRARALGFDFKEVCADKGYIGGVNLLAALLAGMRPYIPFKTNAVAGADKSSVWNRLLHEYRHNNEVWKPHYHQRSNVETTFSMIKLKFDERLRSKTKESQINEILLKALCHNICVLVQSMYEFGLELEGIFRAETARAAKIIPFPHF